MTARRDPGEQIEFALRRHFSAMFTEEERSVLVARIRDWDAAHPDLDRAARTDGWLALARAELAARAVSGPRIVAAVGVRG